MKGKAAGEEKDFSSPLLWQPPTAVYEALEMYNTLYKTHAEGSGPRWSIDEDPTAPTPLYLQDTWKLVPLAAECEGCGSQTHSCGKEGKSKNVKSSLKI